jgi:phenylpropionate dioxygenase-like ring-hydroxylating dioxygenase large terminal subunit
MGPTNSRFLAQPYWAYHHRYVPNPDEEITSVGPGTPGGEYLRRFWQPVERSKDLKDLPRSIRIMGEDLVLFRKPNGSVGCLELHCSHRGTSLEYGLIEDLGIRCCYHGWLFGADGKILETPGEPPDSTYKDRLWHGAYPTYEHGGLVFSYLGPPDMRPPFPQFDSFNRIGYRLEPSRKSVFPCNWLQMEENSMDPVHTTFLHGRVSGVQFTDAFLEMPEMDFVESPIGMVYIATRRVGDNVWIRVNDQVSPNFHQFNRNEEDGQTEHKFWPGAIIQWAVPIDDTNSFFIAFMQVPEDTPPIEHDWGEGTGEDRPNEEQQRWPSDYQALVSQRSIAIHDLEHLADTDRGIIMLRNNLRKRIRSVRNGGEPGILGHKAFKDGKRIHTYANDTVIHLPPAPSPKEDRQLLKKTGLELVQRYFDVHPSLTGDTVDD